ncbi:MAG: GNAT family N-acetyltransferase [Acidimicrobiales bacterium]
MEASGVEIAREAPDGDLAAQLLDHYYAELASRFPEGFDPSLTVPAPAAELMAPRGAFLVAYLDGHPVGCGAVRRLEGTTAEIKRMWIDPVARGRGVGRRLLCSLEDAAAESGCNSVRLDTSALLKEAIGLYRSAGYKEIAAYNENLYAAHWFEKRLG